MGSPADLDFGLRSPSPLREKLPVVLSPGDGGPRALTVTHVCQVTTEGLQLGGSARRAGEPPPHAVSCPDTHRVRPFPDHGRISPPAPLSAASWLPRSGRGFVPPALYLPRPPIGTAAPQGRDGLPLLRPPPRFVLLQLLSGQSPSFASFPVHNADSISNAPPAAHTALTAAARTACPCGSGCPSRRASPSAPGPGLADVWALHPLQEAPWLLLLSLGPSASRWDFSLGLCLPRCHRHGPRCGSTPPEVLSAQGTPGPWAFWPVVTVLPGPPRGAPRWGPHAGECFLPAALGAGRPRRGEGRTGLSRGCSHRR